MKSRKQLNNGKAGKAPCEDDEALKDLYTNRLYVPPVDLPLETVLEAENESEEEPPATSGRLAKRLASKRLAFSKEVRKLEFISHLVADKDRDRQRRLKVTQLKGGKTLRWRGLTPEQEQHLSHILEEQESDLESAREAPKETEKDSSNAGIEGGLNDAVEQHEDPTVSERDEAIIDDAIDRVLKTVSESVKNTGKCERSRDLPEISTPAVSGTLEKSPANDVNKENENQLQIPNPSSPELRDRDEFTRRLLEVDLALGPIDDGELEVGASRAQPNKSYLKVRRSSRFLPRDSSKNDDVGSVFKEVQVSERKDRRRSRRSQLFLPAPSIYSTVEDSECTQLPPSTGHVP